MKVSETLQIHFDGGARPSNPGNRYGSFEVVLDGTSIKIVNEQELGWGSNNEAEFLTLIEALEWTLRSLTDYGFDPRRYAVEMFTDSTIVANRVSGRNRTRKTEPQQRMAALASRVHELLRGFGGFKIEWNSRVENVRRFGH